MFLVTLLGLLSIVPSNSKYLKYNNFLERLKTKKLCSRKGWETHQGDSCASSEFPPWLIKSSRRGWGKGDDIFVEHKAASNRKTLDNKLIDHKWIFILFKIIQILDAKMFPLLSLQQLSTSLLRLYFSAWIIFKSSGQPMFSKYSNISFITKQAYEQKHAHSRSMNVWICLFTNMGQQENKNTEWNARPSHHYTL